MTLFFFLLGGLFLSLGAYVVYYHRHKKTPAQRMKRRYLLVVVLSLVAMTFFSFTGNLLFFLSGLMGVLPLLIHVSRQLGVPLKTFFKTSSGKKKPPQENHGKQKASSQEKTPDLHESMDIKQAQIILNVKENATKKDILKAHKNLIQRVHPDQGGTAYFAAQVNQARDILLKAFHGTIKK